MPTVALLHFQANSPSIYSPTPFGSGLFLECTRAAGLPTAANRNPADIYALGPGNRLHMTLRLSTTPSWCCCLPGSLVPARPATGPPHRWWRTLVYFQQPIYSRKELTDPHTHTHTQLVFLKQEWQVIRAGVASIPAVQLIALGTDDQGGLRRLEAPA